MAITKKDIWKAADEVETTGQAPTLVVIRKVLGGGSFTTISEAMKEWRVKRARETQPPPLVLPESMAEASRQWLAEIWKEAKQATYAEVESERAALDGIRREMEASTLEATKLADQMQQEIEALTADNERIQEALIKAQDRIAKMDKEASAQDQRLDAARERITDLEKRLEGSASRTTELERENAAQRQQLEDTASQNNELNRQLEASQQRERSALEQAAELKGKLALLAEQKAASSDKRTRQ